MLYNFCMAKTKLQRIFNAKSISALSKYLEITPAAIHTWRRGNHKANGKIIEHEYTKKKAELIQLGWEVKCKQALEDEKC